jgi:hypothetical protein
LAAIGIDKRNILIMGGMGADYELISSVYNLDVVSSKFIKQSSMRSKRALNGGAFYGSDKNIYAMNGTTQGDHNCERLTSQTKKWEYVPSFLSINKDKDINEWVGCIKY